jgi:hypothetical protein
MKRKIFLFFSSLFLITLFGNYERAYACMCANLSTCERFTNSDVIFVGKAIEIISEDKAKFPREWTVFEISENIFGSKKQQIKVQNKVGGFGCGVEFERGETYLIFANGDEAKGFGTSFCHGNLPLSYAREELNNLRNLPKTGSGGMLFGQVWDFITKREGDGIRFGLPGIKINIQEKGGSGKIYQAVTDVRGNFESLLPEGIYKLTPVVPVYAELETYSDRENLTFVKDRGCTREVFSMRNKSLISGKVLSAEGKPVSDVKVEFIPIDQKEKNYLESDETKAPNGSFSFNNLPAGKYTLSVNYTASPNEGTPYPTFFYPNARERSKAKIFEVGLGQKIEGIVFRLPPRLATKEIRGTVFWEDGKPAAGIEVYLLDDEFPRTYAGCYTKSSTKPLSNKVSETTVEFIDCTPKTDSQGRFVIRGYQSRKYTVNASFWEKGEEENIEYSAKSAVFSMDEKLPEFKLILKRVEKDRKPTFSEGR